MAASYTWFSIKYLTYCRTFSITMEYIKSIMSFGFGQSLKKYIKYISIANMA